MKISRIDIIGQNGNDGHYKELEMKEHVKRMEEELKELSTKLVGLDNFIEHNEQFVLLEDIDKLLMSTQSVHMTWYRNVLEERISSAKQK